MTKLWHVGVWLGLGAGLSHAQMHKVAKPETVVRAVGVYEWTGDLAKPTASRLIPVTLYIDRKLEDAGLYLARPVPFALGTGTIYELDEAGVAKGNLDLVYARHLQAAKVEEAYDDGWFGYGSFQGLAAAKKPVIRHTAAARTKGIETGGSETAVVASDPDRPHFSDKAGNPVKPGDSAKPDAKSPDTADADPDRPHLTRKSDGAAAGADADQKADGAKGEAGSTPAGDPERPTMKRRTGSDSTETSGASAGTASGSNPADDPDRPTMKRRSGNDTADTSAGGSTGAGSASADDPDRPTLKRHSVEDAKKRAKDAEASVSGGGGSLNDDLDRPNLHRGKPAHALTETELPKLAGLPADLRQMVAVSDAANRPVHNFARPWEDDAERAAILTKMQGIAQAQLAMYGGPMASAAPGAGSGKATAAGPGAAPASVGRANSKLRRPVSPVRVATAALLDQELKGYLLSYGDVPTFVFQAHTDGEGASLRYVTIVAQLDAQHEPKMVLHAVTDAAHLDRTARLRLVDAVDVEASNRASLLFEMRGQTSRQFGVYRVLGLQAEEIFSTGTMQ